MNFEDGPYYIRGKNRVDEMWACVNNEVVSKARSNKIFWSENASVVIIN